VYAQADEVKKRRTHSTVEKINSILKKPISSIPLLGLGSWILAIGWFGFNVVIMSLPGLW
jgi:ammonia channel protein AmtB